MWTSIEEFERDTRILLNENIDGRAWIGDASQLPLSAVIRSVIEEACAEAVARASHEDLERGHNFAEAAICRLGLGSGYLLLPHDFMRLIAFRMSDWECPVFEAITPAAHPEAYALQHSPFRGLRGTPAQPVCAIVNRPEGLSLEYYSCLSDKARIVRAEYAPRPKIDVRRGGIDIGERTYRAAVKLAAAMTKNILNGENI